MYCFFWWLLASVAFGFRGFWLLWRLAFGFRGFLAMRRKEGRKEARTMACEACGLWLLSVKFHSFILFHSLSLSLLSALPTSQSAAPVTKFALQGPQSAAPTTKFAFQGPQSTAPTTKFALQGPQSTAPATKFALFVLQGPQSTALATKNGKTMQKTSKIDPQPLFSGVFSDPYIEETPSMIFQKIR